MSRPQPRVPKAAKPLRMEDDVWHDAEYIYTTLLCISRTSFIRLRNTDSTFPAPVKMPGGRRFSRQAVQSWMRAKMVKAQGSAA